MSETTVPEAPDHGEPDFEGIAERATGPVNPTTGKREPTGYNIYGETMAEYYQRRTNERGRDIELLRGAIHGALNLMKNPHDGGEYEDGEMPAVDILRKALAEVRG